MKLSRTDRHKILVNFIIISCAISVVLMPATACSIDQEVRDYFALMFGPAVDLSFAKRLADESGLNEIILVFDYYPNWRPATAEQCIYSIQPAPKVVVADIKFSEDDEAFPYTYQVIAFGVQSSVAEYILESGEAVAVFSSAANRDPQIIDVLAESGFTEDTSYPSGFRWLRRR